MVMIYSECADIPTLMNETLLRLTTQFATTTSATLKSVELICGKPEPL